ncbi:MAG: chemotaxis protein CheW [Denitrovibrio sp.]|nr:MAG: chemotaxis protein CheW [Denitrovibrio sp.]
MDDTKTDESIQVLTFELGEELFGIDISSVREVLDQSNITKVPQMPEYMVGVINIRGNVVPIIDMNLKFYNRPTVKTIKTCIVITEVYMGDDLVVLGALVDSVDEVITFDANTLEPAPKMGTQLNTAFIKCMAKKDDNFVIVLNVNKVFTTEEAVLAETIAE